MVGSRTLHSLAQFLELLDVDMLASLLDKHQLLEGSDLKETLEFGFRQNLLSAVTKTIRSGGEAEIVSLLDEIVRTSGDLRNRVSPRYRFDERLEDLKRCLELDGYMTSNRRLIPVDP